MNVHSKELEAQKLWEGLESNLERELKKEELGRLFLTLLTTARSIKHLERLHGELPPNHRLPRELLIKLTNVWKAMEKDGDETIKWLLSRHFTEGGLTDTYIKLLNDGREHGRHENWGRIYTSPDEDRSGRSRFRVSLATRPADEKFILELGFTSHCQKLLATFIVWQSQLTEELTHYLRTKVMNSSRCSLNVLYGPCYHYSVLEQVNFSFVLPITAEERPGLYKVCPKRTFFGSPESYYIATEEFLAEVKKQMVAIGVPVAEITIDRAN